MHFLRLFLAFIQKLCLLSLHFPQKLIKGGLEYEGGLENFSKIYKRGGETIIRYLRVHVGSLGYGPDLLTVLILTVSKV